MLTYNACNGKKREIGIMKSMGATPKSIIKIFIFEGGIIASIGITFGAIIGFLICYFQIKYRFITLPTDTYVIDYLPIDLQITDIISILITAMLICFSATLYPAYKASQLNPVEVIRYE